MSNKNQLIILVEPAAFVAQGHFAEKLGLWSRGFDALALQPIIFAWPPPHGTPIPLNVHTVPTLFRTLGRLVPGKYYATWADFWTYLFAFKYARKNGLPVLGLTASSPVPVAWCARIFNPNAAWGQIVMYSGLEPVNQSYQIRSKALIAFRVLVRRGCTLLCNSELAKEILKQKLSKEQVHEQVYFLPDPINVLDKKCDSDPHKWNSPIHLFVPGDDDHRRSPLLHLQQGELEPQVTRLTVLQPGKNRLLLADGVEWNRPGFIGLVELVSSYQTAEALLSMFSGAKFSLIAYDPNFLQGSANLALSITCGTPVLCSRFPYADRLFRSYGRLGEQFIYNDFVDLRKAWNRLTAWKQADWEEFESARAKLASEVRYESVTRTASEILGLRNSLKNYPSH
jgi:hypothetical protein